MTRTADIVKQLRQGSFTQDDYRWIAANKIEQLKAWNEEIALNARHFAEALRLIRDMGPMTVDDQRWRIAKDALEGK